MEQPNDKLDFSSISFDDVIGEGADGLETVQDKPQKAEALDNELDDDVRERGDEDHEDYIDEYVEERKEPQTVEDEYEEDSLEEDLLISDQIADNFGIELEDEYDDTVDGLTSFVRDMSTELAETQMENLLEQYPDVKDHLEYVLNGGDSNKFFETHNPQNDYSNIQMGESDTTLQRAMLGEYFQSKGHPDEFINEMLNDYQDGGKLYNKALIAQQELVQLQSNTKQQLYEEQQESHQAQMQEQEEFWDDVADTIESGNQFAGIRIPDSDKQDFFDYISQPADDTGNTRRDLDYADADMDIKLAIDYLMYTGFDLGDLIDTKARTKSVESLRSRIQDNESRVKSARKAQRQSKRFDPEELDINALF